MQFLLGKEREVERESERERGREREREKGCLVWGGGRSVGLVRCQVDQSSSKRKIALGPSHKMSPRGRNDRSVLYWQRTVKTATLINDVVFFCLLLNTDNSHMYALVRARARARARTHTHTHLSLIHI